MTETKIEVFAFSRKFSRIYEKFRENFFPTIYENIGNINDVEYGTWGGA
jgi:hypothetical protein